MDTAASLHHDTISQHGADTPLNLLYDIKNYPQIESP